MHTSVHGCSFNIMSTQPHVDLVKLVKKSAKDKVSLLCSRLSNTAVIIVNILVK